MMWRLVVLRGTGFPAKKVLSLAASDCASAADRLLELEVRAESLRERAIEVLNETLDRLRQRGEWGDKSRRKPLLDAFRAVKNGQLPEGIEEHRGLVSVCEAARSAHHRLATARRQFESAYETDLDRNSQELEDLLGDDRFREAVTWQNHRAVDTILRTFGQIGDGRKRNSQRRQREEMLANYLQRYCVKNDTIGFFGPVGWARLVDGGDPIRVRPGPRFLEHRRVYFESWAIDTLARKLGREPALKPWLAPRLRSSFHLTGETLYAPFKTPLELPPDEARLLAACDGRRTARALAEELVADPAVSLATEEEVFESLEALCKRRIVVWNLEVPMELHPERSLAEQLQRIERPDLRERTSAALEELDAARRRVARAAGDAQALGSAMRELESTFSRLTGAPASRRHGETYAARGLVYEDCRRGVEVEIGPEVVRRLGPPLTLVLQGAQWMTGDLTRRVTARMRTIYAEMRRRGGCESVEGYPWLSQVLSSLFLKRERDADFVELEEEFRRRWSRVLELDAEDRSRRRDFTVSELAGRAEREFGDPGRVWTLARYLSPDVMLAADSAAELRQGRFQIILGELHCGNCMSWSCFISNHPAPEEIHRYVELDMDHHFGMASRSFVLPQLLSRSLTQRMAISLLLPRFLRLQFGDEPPGRTGCEVLPAGELVVFESAEGLMAGSRDGRLRFEAIDLLGPHLVFEANAILGSMLEPAAHRPRISVDGMVISRERWRFAAAELDLDALGEPGERFLAARRWARRHGLPRFCFYKFSHEVKPCFLDFDSPIYVDIFLKMVRTATQEATTFSVSEMLPRVDQTWLSDAEGRCYTCELRTATFLGAGTASESR